MKFYSTVFCSLLFLFCISTSSILANIINVPADQSTIQAGINVAINGDTVLVADGLYYENINFIGKAITVASHFLIDGDTSHISNTIIDGSQPSNPNNGSVVYFKSGEDTTSVLCGFTITGGTGTLYPNNNRVGGGIHILKASPCIRNNYIEFNTITNATDGFGAGIDAEQFNNKDLIIKDNIIRKNSIISANSIKYSLGAGIYTWAFYNETVYITGNRILNNTISATEAYGCGITPANAGNATYVIKNNIISGNIINASVGGSGGIDVYNQTPVMRNNVITNNSAPFAGGIGIYFEMVKYAGYKRGGDTQLRFKNTDSILVYYSNNTIAGNFASDSGGGIGVFGGTIPDTLMNFIVWGNTAPTGAQISGSVTVEYSDIEGGHPGIGNIDSDPLFEDTLFHLSAGSPCIDAGNPDPTYNDPDGTRNDMGAYGGPNRITGLYDIKDNIKVPTSRNLKQNYPNPFNPSTKIKFSLPKPETVKIEVYNIIGQKIQTLLNKPMPAGYHEVEFNGQNLSSGVYLYRIEAEAWQDVKKMILLK